MSNCPVCEVQVAMPATPRLSEILECEDCRSELEIVAVDPLLLAVAPEVEEDWGE
ncbi:MAG: lysine biosynthesis protein LysW [Streptosporangiaceae bacterium]